MKKKWECNECCNEEPCVFFSENSPEVGICVECNWPEWEEVKE